METPSRQKTNRDIKQFFGTLLTSTFVQIFVCLVAFDALLNYIKPLQYIGMGGYVAADQNPLYAKFNSLINHDAPIDVLLLGSSLVMCASQRADIANNLTAPSSTAVETSGYSKSLYLQKLLSKAAGRNLSVMNFAGPSCMISDALLILKNSIATGHTPGAVIIGIAPRDFIDNQVSALGTSPYCSFFANHGKSDSNKRDSYQQQVEDGLERWWHFFQIRADYRILGSLATTGYFHRAQDLYSATKASNVPGGFPLTWISPYKAENARQVIDSQIMSKSLSMYERQYLPINISRYKQEYDHLRQLMALCKEKSIKLSVINMPLTHGNEDILPKEFKKQYAQDLYKICSSNGVPLVDLRVDTSFRNTDFYDSAHVNTNGAPKIWNHFVSELDRQGQLTGLLTTAPSVGLAQAY